MFDNKTFLAAGLGALVALGVAPQTALADPIPCPAAQAGAPHAEQAITINPHRNIIQDPSVMGIPLHYDSVVTEASPYGGRGWALAVPRLEVAGTQARLFERGRTTTFQLTASHWAAPLGDPRKLVSTGASTFELRGNNGTHISVFQNGRMIEERSAYRTLAQWSYDGAGKLTQVRDPRTGVTTSLTYNGENRLVSVTQGNLKQTLGYSLGDFVAPVPGGGPGVGPPGGIDGQLASISLPSEIGGAPSGEAAHYAYTAGVMSSASASNGDTTWYTVGADGGLLSIRYADTYAVVLTCESAPAGAILYRMSDSFGQTIEQTSAASGEVVATSDAYGNTTTYSWNAAGQMTSRSADGQSEQWTFDADGALLSARDALGQTTTYAHSGERLLSETDHLGRSIIYGYDDNGFLNAVTDSLGRTTRMVNNTQGDVVQTTTPDGLVMRRTLNNMGDVTSVTGPDNRTISYTVNATGDVTAVQYPDGTSETFTYLAGGRLASATGRDGRSTSYTYDSRDRLINVALPGGRNIATERDNLGRPIRVTRNLGARAQVEERGYGLNGVVAWSRRNGMMDQVAPPTFAPLGVPVAGAPNQPRAPIDGTVP
jgi:YD repeat-containing protein